MRIVIGEDDALLRDALARLLAEAGHDVVGTAGDAVGLVDKARAARPDLVIADVRMPPTQRDEGLSAVRTIRATAPGTAVLVLSQHLQVRYAVELAAGDARGVGYLLKQRMADAGRFGAALERIGAGGTVIDAEVVSAMLGRLRTAPLGTGERAVLALVAQGDADASIGATLDIPESEVARRTASAFATLGLAVPAEGHERVSALLRRAAQPRASVR